MEERQLSEQALIKQQKDLQDLVNIAFESGISKAVESAKKMDDPYILDAFHDILVDELYKELIERDKLEEL